MDGRVMYSDRDSIHEDIRKRLVKIKGIGPEKAAKGSDAVMEYLDSLVQNQAEPSPKPGERDEDGIECIKRPKSVDKGANYLYWDNISPVSGWTHPVKPVEFNPYIGHYTCEGIGQDPEGYVDSPTLFDILTENRICDCEPEDRIVRLVD